MKLSIPTTRATTAYGYLTAIAKLVMEEPKRLAMNTVCVRGESLKGTFFKQPSCGTVGCIAGWALTLARKTDVNEDNHGLTGGADSVLGLDGQQSYELFLPDALIFAKNQQTKAHARATVKHIQKFQAKYATQLKAHKIAKQQPAQA